MSRSSVERGSPCSELASDPAVTYATPSRSRMASTASATRSGSGRPSGAIGRSPRVGAPDGLGSKAERCEPEQQLGLRGRGMAAPQAREGHRAGGARQIHDAGGLLGGCHPRVPLESHRVGLRRGVRQVNGQHAAIWGCARVRSHSPACGARRGARPGLGIARTFLSKPLALVPRWCHPTPRPCCGLRVRCARLRPVRD